MGYIFTEFFFDVFKLYLNINYLVSTFVAFLLTLLANLLPYLVKYLIGYCHFYYQLGYGLVFYIYLYRRRNAKKTNNWTSFYGNSIPNWILFNISILNKFIFTRTFITFVKNSLKKFYVITQFWFINFINTEKTMNKLRILIKQNYSRFFNFTWTPLFKRTSYISFSTFLKRFTKRK